MRRNRKATSTIEYALLIIIIMGAVLLSQRYIVRGFAGRWKAVGDTFGQGKQYDPRRTIECTWSQQANRWYDQVCFDQRWEAAFKPNWSRCTSDCIFDGGTTSECGGGATGCSYRSFFGHPVLYDGNCCSQACSTVCTSYVTPTVVNNCLTINGINCN